MHLEEFRGTDRKACYISLHDLRYLLCFTAYLQVTLAGHSSGATSVFALLASPAADGLYHRAWLSSGSVSLNKTLAEASAANLAFLNNTGCQDVDCLYQLTAEQLMRAIPIERWIADNLNELPMKGIFNDPLAIADGRWNK